MSTLKFQPKVFIISEAAGHTGPPTWDLLTLDGENPRNTIYFMRKGDAPSHASATCIEQAIENEDWEIKDGEIDLNEFYIDPKIFDTAGDAYAEIRAAIA